MPTNHSIIVSGDVMMRILTATVLISQCHPGKLFKVQITKSGMTSDWNGVKLMSTTFSEILDETRGAQLTMRPFVAQVDKYLRSLTPPKIWNITNLDGACDGLRVALRSIVSLVTNVPHRPPLRHGHLQVLMDEIDRGAVEGIIIGKRMYGLRKERKCREPLIFLMMETQPQPLLLRGR